MSTKLDELDIVFISIMFDDSDEVITDFLFDNSLPFSEVKEVMIDKHDLLDRKFNILVER